MILEMKKFGIVLNSRQAGREAILSVKQIVNGMSDNELIFDFAGVEVLTPSFADELSLGIKEIYPNKTIKYQGYEGNLVVKDVLKKLQLI